MYSKRFDELAMSTWAKITNRNRLILVLLLVSCAHCVAAADDAETLRQVYMKKNYLTAMMIARRMLESHPGDTNTRCIFANCLAKTGRTNEARAQYDYIIKTGTGQIVPYAQQARAAISNGLAAQTDKEQDLPSEPLSKEVSEGRQRL